MLQALGNLAQLEGWARRATLFAAGVVSVLAVAPLFVWPVLLITFPLLAFMLAPENSPHAAGALSRKVLLRAAGTGWWFGFGYFAAGLHWIVEPFLVDAKTFGWLIPFAITLMPGGLALFFAAAAALARALWLPGWCAAFPLAVAFGITEWLRGWIFTGFPWNPVGDGLTGTMWTLQWASVIGINGLNLLAVLIFTIPLLLALDVLSARVPRRHALIVAGVCGTLLIGGLGFGAQRAALTTPTHPDIRLRLVQPVIPQDQKWLPEKRRWIFDQLLDLSRLNSHGLVDDMQPVTHVIWPEAAMPFLPLRTPQALKEIASLLPTGRTLITGALRVELVGDGNPFGPRETYNTLLAFDDRAQLIGQYDKQHLVPFGEYLPFQNVLEAIGLQQLTRLRGGFTPGAGRRFLTIPGLPGFTPLVCYEVIFSRSIVTTPMRPDWLLVITNDAWFGRWAGPRQHFHQARVRAVEEGLPLVRVSNNGISAMITPVGHVPVSLDLNVRGAIDVTLPNALPLTVFAQYGNKIFWALIAICLITISVFRRFRGEF